MAPSQKRKRKPLPKRLCPCCRAILSEKTIERHASGSHVPTRINVTLAAAAAAPSQKHADLKLSSMGDISGSSSDEESDICDVESSGMDIGHETTTGYHVQVGLDTRVDEDPQYVDPPHFEEPEHDLELEEIVHNTWSGRRATVEDYESDDEEDDIEGNEFVPEPDPDIETEGMGERYGLEMDDLVDEDFQRIIYEFCAFFPSF